MTRKYLLEISVDSVEKAVAAERGGADRIELCADLSVGGLTPSPGEMVALRANVQIPIFAMIRPRAGDFVYSDEEFVAMRSSIKLAKQLQMDGVVLGVLTADKRVDVRRTRDLVELARGMETTFHRAFDECLDISREGVEFERALDDVIQTGTARILTSGGAKTALEGATRLAKLIAAAGDRIAILPGAGISAANIAEVARRTGAREFHSGLSTELPYSSPDVSKFEAAVRNLAEQLTRSGE